jgi:chromosomal replication initiation ATPase DnaA
MHACNKVSDEIKSNESFRKMIEQLKTQITGVDK